MNTFVGFLEHVMKKFDASCPYGLSKTEVTRLTFLAWCTREEAVYETAKEKTPIENLKGVIGQVCIACFYPVRTDETMGSAGVLISH